MEQLNHSLEDATMKLRASEELKKSFEIETQSLHEKIAEMGNDLEQRNTKLNELESENVKKVIKNLILNQCCVLSFISQASQIEQLNQSLDDVTKKFQDAEIFAKKLQDERNLSQTAQMEQLNQSLNETTNKLRIAEEQKKTFENQIQSFNEKMTEMKNNLEQREIKFNELASENSKKVVKNKF